ncbi:MAG: Holliday junction branch migration protein RuvA [Bacteroidota bacterium]|jgi:Holliday junction DNA helicase RuvA
MYEFIEGNLEQLTPTQLVLSAGGMGYHIHISLYTYEQLRPHKQARVFVHLGFRIENQAPVGMVLYGFAQPQEREMFRLLISVSGVGNNTAMLMLSSLQPDELQGAILNGNVALLKAVKGIGEKTAQRIILELRDRMGVKSGRMPAGFVAPELSAAEEAAEALLALGFQRANVDKALTRVTREHGSSLKVEDFIKHSLKIL